MNNVKFCMDIFIGHSCTYKSDTKRFYVLTLTHGDCAKHGNCMWRI